MKFQHLGNYLILNLSLNLNKLDVLQLCFTLFSLNEKLTKFIEVNKKVLKSRFPRRLNLHFEQYNN